MRQWYIAVCAILAIMAVSSMAQQPFNIHQLHALKRVSESAVSPRGDIAVYSVRQYDEASRKAKTQLEAVAINTTSTRKLTTSSLAVEASPVFSPDGLTVAFQGDDENTIYQANVANGAVTVLARLPVPITSIKWAPSGKFIIFSAKVFVDCADPQLECTAQRFATIASREPNTGYEYTQLYVRHWDTYETEGAYFHIFMLPVGRTGDGTWAATGSYVDLMYKMMAAGPVPPFGGSEQYDISPAGDEVAFTCETIEHETAWRTGWKVYKVSTNGGAPVLLTGYTSARTQNPIYSPDGRTIAYFAMDRPGKESDKLHLVLYNRASGATTTPLSWDRSIGTAQWAFDSDSFFFSVDEDARVKVFHYRVSTNKLTLFIEDGHNGNALVVPNSPYVIISRDSMSAPSDIWQFTFRQDTINSLKQLTNYNQAALSNIWMSKPQRYYFQSNGTTIQGWLLLPFGWDASKEFPLVQLIHGGPEGAWDDAWSSRWNPQLWASAGFVTIAVNPRGSSGFGQAYQDAVARDWGGQPYFDLMAGNDYILKQLPNVNPKRMAACGASYGGFMINWIMGQTDRFAALVTHDGVFDAMGMYYGSEEVFFNEDEFGPPPFSSDAAHQMYQKFSPVNYVKNWKTPTLVIHGGRDYRIPESQGLSVFTALQRKGIPSKLLIFPMENHWVINPLNSIQWYNNVLGWIKAYTSTPDVVSPSMAIMSSSPIIKSTTPAADAVEESSLPGRMFPKPMLRLRRDGF